ncbi:DUF523 domain-containing protein [Reinekea blandensis]|uniref:Uncharacterized protein n=1 Tax=Reinekea blandensis MED297 TaxID=314283 RepID=A4BE84_9GAMM|nr:DUF523 domain-containing protein [Reinekea blandensis]EAR09562.1 hypothetical protein MED297_12562 [Reinekea blandensis MED297]
MTAKILVSACLLGDRVRYDGADNSVSNDWLQRWKEEGRLVPVCPEVSGGLPIPRPPSEIQGGNGEDVLSQQASIVDIHGRDVTREFLVGAEQALATAQKYGCRFALLAARSPSCGNEQIYDGTFSGALIPGAGATAALLKQNGIQVFNQAQIVALAEQLKD